MLDAGREEEPHGRRQRAHLRAQRLLDRLVIFNRFDRAGPGIIEAVPEDELAAAIDERRGVRARSLVRFGEGRGAHQRQVFLRVEGEEVEIPVAEYERPQAADTRAARARSRVRLRHDLDELRPAHFTATGEWIGRDAAIRGSDALVERAHGHYLRGGKATGGGGAAVAGQCAWVEVAG